MPRTRRKEPLGRSDKEGEGEVSGAGAPGQEVRHKPSARKMGPGEAGERGCEAAMRLKSHMCQKVVNELARDTWKSYLGQRSPGQWQNESMSLRGLLSHISASSPPPALSPISLAGQLDYFCLITYLYKLPDVWDRLNRTDCEDGLFRMLPESGLTCKTCF